MSTYLIKEESKKLTNDMASFDVKFIASDGTESGYQYYEVHNVGSFDDPKIHESLIVTGDSWQDSFIIPDYLTYNE